MGITVAISAERDQIFVCVVTQSASRANVVDLKVIGNCRSTGIASRHAPTLRCGVCDKNPGRAEASVAVVEDQPLDSLHLLHELHFLRIRKQ